MRAPACLGLVSVAAFAGCTNGQTALDPHGPEARSLADLLLLFTLVLGAIWLVTNGAMVASLRRRRPAGLDPLATDPGRERRMTVTVSVAVALTAVTVVALTALSYGAQRSLYGTREGALTLKVTGHQWWWEVAYEDDNPSRTFTTANEIRIPVGEPVRIKLEADDVIHSFWVPSLAGKLDLIPGRQNVISIAADRPGLYRGQCAEFCGFQHAHMSMLVIAEPREDFERWRTHQLSGGNPPATADLQRGMEIFLSKACVMCHQVRGTDAGGRVAPDLTHVGSRRMIAAGTLPNTRGNLAAWITDPQGIKPGAHMPLVPLAPDEVEPLARYLESLQ